MSENILHDLVMRMRPTEDKPLMLGNVEFWVDNSGPWKDELSYSLPVAQWDRASIISDIERHLRGDK